MTALGTGEPAREIAADLLSRTKLSKFLAVLVVVATENSSSCAKTPVAKCVSDFVLRTSGRAVFRVLISVTCNGAVLLSTSLSVGSIGTLASELTDGGGFDQPKSTISDSCRKACTEFIGKL